LDEYNAFRYTDYCFRAFFEKARKASYFQNTIFVFVGDHGVAGNATSVYPEVWTSQRLTDQHVPLLFYAPGMIPPQRRKEVVSQIDVLPTLFGLLHRPYENRTLGRDLLTPRPKKDFAFITNASDMIGVITNEHYFTHHLNSGEQKLFLLNDSVQKSAASAQKKTTRELAELTYALFETSRYMIMNNKKD
jgi:phosphoglycerol transferase MdoB-like AlkP superfamily enzyme